jgi:hypothetical protein
MKQPAKPLRWLQLTNFLVYFPEIHITLGTSCSTGGSAVAALRLQILPSTPPPSVGNGGVFTASWLRIRIVVFLCIVGAN